MNISEVVTLMVCVAVLFMIAVRTNEDRSSTIRSLIWATFLTAAFFAIIRYYWPVDEGVAQQLSPGQSFRAPVSEQVLARPLVTEIDFVDGDITCTNTESITVDTERYTAVLSPCGAIISRFSCKRMLDGKPGAMTTLLTNLETERERSSFLVALERNTPLRYTFIEKSHEGRETRVSFLSKTDTCRIEKVFIFHDDSYQIDMQLSMEPYGGGELRPRIFVSAPFIFEEIPPMLVRTGEEKNVTLTTFLRGIVLSDRGVINKFDPSYLEGRMWVMPEIFGGEDRYFVHSLVHDTHAFVERAYYRMHGTHALATVLEGPMIREKKSWSLSWYCGPKQAEEFNKVEPRLNAVLDYGWLSPISSTLFWLMRLLYTYIKNYGLVIILITILLKLLMLPLSLRADRSQKRMVEVQKRLKFIDQKYKHDRVTRDQERMELMKRHGMGDFGMSFIPRLLQIFVFLGLNRVLSLSIELYRAPFVGWIHNLAAPDPYYILPTCMGLGIFLTMREVMDARQFVTIIIMSLFITGVMMNFAAGVVLFSCTWMWLDILQKQVQSKVGRTV